MTSVGATALSGTSSETAASFSSGGFSNYFGTPSYQSAAVHSFLTAQGSTNSGKFNTSGRAYPDVSAIGQDLEIVVSGSSNTVSGTSCSSPIFASVISLINDELISAGKSPLGFLNPFLYANPGAFHDVTSGESALVRMPVVWCTKANTQVTTLAAAPMALKPVRAGIQLPVLVPPTSRR